jgi:uncharacterized protein with HEPN domain
MLHAIEEIRSFCHGISRDDFLSDPKTQKAVAADLVILGEAAARMPRDVMEAYPQLPWNQMRGMRNHIIHAYFNVAPEVLWDTVEHDLAPVEIMIRTILGESSPRA